MCAPVAAIGAGISLASTVISGIAANQRAKAQAKALEVGAQNRLNQGVDQQNRFARQARAQRAEEELAVSNSGFLPTGSLARVLEENEASRFTDQLQIGQNARTGAQAISSQASQVRTQGRNALFGSFLQAGAQFARRPTNIGINNFRRLFG